MNKSQILNIKSFQESKFLKIWLIYSFIAFLSFIVQYQNYLTLDALLIDQGAALKANYLISNGFLPSVDFTYIYGLLPLVLGKVWLGIFGSSLQSFFAWLLVSQIICCAILARITIIANLTNSGIIFISSSVLFFCLWGGQYSFTHSLEPVFILLALSEHLLGKKGNALTFLVFGYFTKPSMSLVYAGLIFILFASDLIQAKTNIKKVSREILPVILAVIFLVVSLSIIFSIDSVIASVLAPIKGAAVYKAYDYGLFGVGGRFLYFSGVRIGYYIGTPAGFWIVLTFTIFITALFFLFRIFSLKQDIHSNHVVKVIICIAVSHAIFIVRFFGHPASWSYYCYLLIVGIALLGSKNITISKILVKNLLIFLTIIMLVPTYVHLLGAYKAWANSNQSTLTMGLNSAPELKKEFEEVLGYCQTKKVFVLGEATGGMDVSFPKCKSPDAWWLLKGIYNQKETERIGNQISQSSIVVLYAHSGDDRIIEHLLISYRGQLESFKSEKKGKYFEFLVRK